MSASINRVQIDGHEGYALSAPGGEWTATFLPHLGMVGSSLRHQGHELLAQRGGVCAYAERGSTFGIPLLHPWANRLGGWSYQAAGQDVTLRSDAAGLRVDGDSGLPIHGLLAASPWWTVRELAADSEAALVTAQLDFAAHQDLMSSFPFAHRLELSVRLTGQGLGVAATLTATGAEAVPVSFGFHPYLRLPASRGETRVALPVQRRMGLDGRGLPTGEHEAVARGELDGSLAGREFDDCFDELHGTAPRFVISGDERETAVSFAEGFPVAQVFSPPDADFICFEPMTAPVDALRTGQGLRLVAPGRSFRTAFAISSRAR